VPCCMFAPASAAAAAAPAAAAHAAVIRLILLVAELAAPINPCRRRKGDKPGTYVRTRAGDMLPVSPQRKSNKREPSFFGAASNATVGVE
jgi:hypothetical protein